MTTRQWITTLGLLALVVLAAIGLVLTRDSAQTAARAGAKSHAHALVDEQPLVTARSVAVLASDRDEQRFALEAVKLADHEVDLAFADGLRDAAENPVATTAQARELLVRENKAGLAIQADQVQIEKLKKQVAAASGATQDTLQQQLDFSLVQLELDQDELEDAKDQLLRSGADPLSQTQRQFNRHEANEHALEGGPQAGASLVPEVNYLAGNLWTQFTAWSALRSKRMKLQQAFDEASGDALRLGQRHDALDKELKAEGANQLVMRQKAATQRAGTAQDANAASAAAARAAISSMQELSEDKKDLDDLNKRSQDNQEMANAYSSWMDRVRSHEHSALHGMTRSGLLLALILLAIYLAERVADQFFIEANQERKRLLTLRLVVHFSVRAVGVLLMLFVLLGTPSQVPAIVGLAGAGAGLTVALKDFIAGFFGWFVLMGRNGIRVGDWVEINEVVGEVVEINLFRTILLETGNWADPGHPTGRKVAFVNSFAIEGHFFNFSTSGQWLWDEIEILLPSNQDPYPLIEAIQKMVAHETEANGRAAEEEWKRATRSRHAQSVSATPAINLRPTALGVELRIRYITQAHERYTMRTHLYQVVVELLRRKSAGQHKTENLPAAT